MSKKEEAVTRILNASMQERIFSPLSEQTYVCYRQLSDILLSEVIWRENGLDDPLKVRIRTAVTNAIQDSFGDCSTFTNIAEAQSTMLAR
jgi:hypothetical protein